LPRLGSRVQVPFPAPNSSVGPFWIQRPRKAVCLIPRRRSQVVRRGSAKPLSTGSNPVVASNNLPWNQARRLRLRCRDARESRGAPLLHGLGPLKRSELGAQRTSRAMPRRPRGGRPRAAGPRRSLLVLARGYLSGRHRDRHRDAPDLFEHHYDQSSGRCGQVPRRYDLVPHRHDPVPHHSEPSPHHSEPDGYHRELEMHCIDRVLHHRESVPQRYEQDLRHRDRIPTHVEPATHHSQRLPCHSMLGL
jgi:hypothetical protein